MLKPKYKKCKICSETFVQRGMGHIYCSPKCAISGLNKSKTAPKLRQTKTKKEKDKAYYVKSLQVVFNRYIRLRDAADPCISCGKHRTKYHAGHYLSVGGHSNLRFNENNVHKQCVYCNLFLSGNLLGYRLGLINKIGLMDVKELESKHEPRKYTIDELIIMISGYKDKVKYLLAEEASKCID